MNVYGELTRAQLENLTSDPSLSSVIPGRMWYRTDLTAPKIDLGGTADTFALLNLAQTLTNKTMDFGPSATNVMKSTGASLNTVPTSDGAGNINWSAPTSAPTSSVFYENGSLSVSVGSNALTINLVQASGSNPGSGSSAVGVGMRNPTSAIGTYNFRTVTSALSLVVPSGTTLGTASGGQAYLYVYLMDNAGTLVLAVSMTIFDEGSVQSSSAISGGSSATTLYSTSAQTNLPIRLIGRIKITEATAGTWATNATEVSNIPFTTSFTAAYVGYFPSLVSNTYWVTSSATYADPGVVGSPSLTSLTNINFGTVSFASSTAGITFVAPYTGIICIEATFATFYWNNNNASWITGYRLYEATTSSVLDIAGLESETGVNNSFNQGTVVLKGYLQVAAGTTYVFKIQMKVNTGSVHIGDSNTDSCLSFKMDYLTRG